MSCTPFQLPDGTRGIICGGRSIRPIRPTSPTTTMQLSLAQKYAADIVFWLRSFCHRCEITGSIRRARPQCSDIDLCIIPKVTIQKDLLGEVTSQTNHVWQHLVDYCNTYDPAALKRGQTLPKVLSGGERPGHRMTVQLPACQLDIWFATEEAWACKMINSTGSMEHNIWLAQRATERDMHWFVSQGIAKLDRLSAAGIDPKEHGAPAKARAAGCIANAPDESYFYGLLGLGFIEPVNRELPWLQKNIDSGL